MSGFPSWALLEPSVNSTSEWTMAWGWISTPTRSRGTPKRWCASIVSSALFIMVAESMVTLGPIDQRGCSRACSSVTVARSSAGRLQKGPPVAVRSSRLTDSRCSPQRHCQIALCSESTGRMASWLWRARSMTSSPAITRTSLVASATFLWARSAAMVGGRAWAPGMATRTRSHSGWVTISSVRASQSGSAALAVKRAARCSGRLPVTSPKTAKRPG